MALYLVFLSLVVFPGAILSLSLTVTTPLGEIEGRVAQYNGTDVILFLGVPYAKPPLKELMLQKPQPVSPWPGVLNATQYGPACVQTRNYSKQSLDCLLLNIYIPRTIQINSTKAVMLFIHGGAYKYMSGEDFDGSSLAVTGNVIVVTINYRLDVYGFISTEDDVIPGNYGLWDQRLAIKWVKENIHSFGGDGNAITIFGESAGSYSIGMHMLSPANLGLFQRVICESGSAVSPIGLTYDAKTYARSVSDTLNCTVFTSTGVWNTSALRTCLKSKTIQEVLAASSKAGDCGALAYRRVIGPVVDGDFVKDPLAVSFQRDDIPLKDIDLMAGTNSAEGGQLLYLLKGYQKSYNFILKNGIPKHVFKDHIAFAFSRDYYGNKTLALDQMMKRYSAFSISDIDQARQAVNMYGDFMLQAPTIETLEYHSQLATSKKTYQYFFSFVPEKEPIYPWFEGVNHADELPYVFGPPQGASDRGKQFTQDVQVYWTNFAKYGNPNGQGEEVWPEFNKETRKYMTLNSTQTVGTDLLHDRVGFWRNELPQTLTDATDSASTVTINMCLLLCILWLSYVQSHN